MGKSTYKRPSREAAVSTLRTLFPNTEMTQDEIIAAAGRSEMDAALNEGWLSGKKTALYYYRFIEPVYTTQNGKRKLMKLRLTSEGVKALGRHDNPSNSGDSGNTSLPPDNNGSGVSLTLDQMLDAVEKLNAKHTTFQVKLIVEPRVEEVPPTK